MDLLWTVSTLRTVVSTKFDIEEDSIKLLCKGKLLNAKVAEKTLKSLKIKQNDKLILMNRPRIKSKSKSPSPPTTSSATTSSKSHATSNSNSNQTTTSEISGDNDDKQQDAIVSNPEKEIQAKEASDPLLRLYRFAYESMTNMDTINASVVESFQNEKAFKTINGTPDSMRMQTLLTAMRQMLSISQDAGQSLDKTMNKKKLSAKDKTINDKLAPLTVSDHDAVSKQEIVSPVHRRPKDDKSKFVRSQKSDSKSNGSKLGDNILGERLYKLCADDQVDEAIMLILRYKLKDDNHSALAICKYEVQNADDGHDWWGYHGNRKNSMQYAIERVYDHFMDKKPEINQHSMRRLFLLKMLLKEGASIYGLLEGKVPRLQTVWGRYWKSVAYCKNREAVDLIFQCGAGIHDVNHKGSTKGQGRKYTAHTTWAPIHEAMRERNVPVMKHLLNAGAKSNGYFMRFFTHERGPYHALYPTAMCGFMEDWRPMLGRKSSDEGMLKCFLKHCDPKKNGFPDVNHYSFNRKEVPIPKPPTPPPQKENVPNTHADEDSDEYSEESDDYDSEEGL